MQLGVGCLPALQQLRWLTIMGASLLLTVVLSLPCGFLNNTEVCCMMRHSQQLAL
jgi:hypothetical protein